MNNSTFMQFILCGICFLVIQQGITANTNNCKTPKLGPADPLVITIFDSEIKQGYEPWDQLCEAVKQFPKGLVTLDYRAGALATGTVKDIKCGSGDCKNDQIQGCYAMHSPNYNDCYQEMVVPWVDVMRCYCNQDANKLLLDNAALRVAWNVPESAIPAYVMNKVYDPCFKFANYKEALNYLCQVYQKQVGKC